MEKIIQTLVERGYSEAIAKNVGKNLSSLSGKFRDAVAAWVEKGEENVISSHGYSTKSLMERFPGMRYPAALLTIDWLEQEPDEAMATIEKGIR